MEGSNWYSLDPKESPYWIRNMECCRKREPLLADRVESGLEWLRDYQFLQIGEGQYACREKEGETCLYNPDLFQSTLQAGFDRLLRYFLDGVEMAVIAGAGLGYLAAHAEENIRGNYDRGLLLLENRQELIAAQFCLFDCRRLIESTQVFWGVDRTLPEAVRSVYERYRLDLIPPNKIAPLQERWLSDGEKRDMQQIGSWIGQRWKVVSAELVRRQDRYNRAMKEKPNLEKGCIWAMATPDAYAHTPLIRSLLSGFEELGWTRTLLEIRDGFATRYRVSDSIVEAVPDVFLICNTSSATLLSPDSSRPCACWMLDHPRYYSGDAFRQQLMARDSVFYIDREYGRDLEGTQAGSYQFLPASACLLRKGIRRKELEAPILFVGSYQDASPFYQSLPRRSLEEIEAVLGSLIQHPTQTGSQALASLPVSEETYGYLRKKAREFTINIQERLPDMPRQIDYFLYALANSRKREKSVRELLELGMVIYGPDSWKPVLGERYASQYRGWISPDDLADAYASADIVLNVHSLQCPTCLNPRDFDVLAAGGCLLTDWVEDVERGIVEPGRDCVVAKGIHTLAEEARRLLDNPAMREEIRERGHSTYLERHTPRHRAEEIVKVLKGRG